MVEILIARSSVCKNTISLRDWKVKFENLAKTACDIYSSANQKDGAYFLRSSKTNNTQANILVLGHMVDTFRS